MRALLRQQGAQSYALISASWVVRFDTTLPPAEVERLSALMSRHGSAHPELKPMRTEIYSVTAGDRDGTVMVVFDVKRNRKGKIIKLTRQAEFGNNERSLAAGRMVDLLAGPRH